MAPDSATSENLAKILTDANINVKCSEILHRTHSQFVAHSPKVTNEYYNWLSEKIDTVKGLQFVYDPVNYYCGETDFTIIISGN